MLFTIIFPNVLTRNMFVCSGHMSRNKVNRSFVSWGKFWPPKEEIDALVESQNTEMERDHIAAKFWDMLNSSTDKRTAVKHFHLALAVCSSLPRSSIYATRLLNFHPKVILSHNLKCMPRTLHLQVDILSQRGPPHQRNSEASEGNYASISKCGWIQKFKHRWKDPKTRRATGKGQRVVSCGSHPPRACCWRVLRDEYLT